MTAPERIRVAQDADGFWTCREAISGSQEYVRADIYEAALSVPPAAIVGEPVAYRWSFDGGDTWNYGTLKPGKMRFGDPDIIEPLYAAPPALGGKP